MITRIVEATQGDGWTNHGKFNADIGRPVAIRERTTE